MHRGEASGPDDDVITMEVGIRTELFGLVEGTMKIPFQDEKIAWAPNLTFPSLDTGERVGRRLTLGDRADILAKDGTPLAEGASRNSPLGSDAIDVAGEVGEPDAELKPKVEQEGYPGDQETGVSGLELAFNSRLAGKPGGELLAVPEGTTLPDVPSDAEGRVLAASEQQPGQPLKTTIDPDIQQVTVSALGGRSGGVAVLDARNGQVRALAGSAYSAPQPPGSTFKVVTTTAALEEDKVKLDDVFDVVTSTNPSPETGANVVDNAHDEPCGGTFEETFADSCNTVFAPLAVDVGEVLHRYGLDPEVVSVISSRFLLPKLGLPSPAARFSFGAAQGARPGRVRPGAAAGIIRQIEELLSEAALPSRRIPAVSSKPNYPSRFQSARILAAFATADQKEGMAAFTEKRQPQFKDR